MNNGILRIFRDDIQSIFNRDPAARTVLEIILCYPGLHAIWFHRLSRWFWMHGFKLLGRCLSQFARMLTGIEIHPGATIGTGFFIDHGMGVVIGETAEIGHNVTLYHGVTLGGVSIEKGKRHPTIEDEVVIGAGSKVLGAITIGRGSRIGANAVVVKSVPSNSVVVGIPGQVVMRSKPHLEPDLHHDKLPDTIGMSLTAVMERLDTLENKLRKSMSQNSVFSYENGNGRHPIPHPESEGVWRGEDFMI